MCHEIRTACGVHTENRCLGLGGRQHAEASDARTARHATELAGLQTEISQFKTEISQLKADVSQLESDLAGSQVGEKSLREELRVQLAEAEVAEAWLGESSESVVGDVTPLRYRLFTPELQWQSRGKTAYLTGRGANCGRAGRSHSRTQLSWGRHRRRSRSCWSRRWARNPFDIGCLPLSCSGLAFQG